MKMRSRLLKVRSEIDQLLMEAKMTHEEFWLRAYQDISEKRKISRFTNEILNKFKGVKPEFIENISDLVLNGKFDEIEDGITQRYETEFSYVMNAPNSRQLRNFMKELKNTIYGSLKSKIEEEHGDTEMGKELLKVLNKKIGVAEKVIKKMEEIEDIKRKADNKSRSLYLIMFGGLLLIFTFVFLVDEKVLKTLSDSIKKVKSSIVNAFDSKGLISGLISMIVEPIKEFLKFLISYPVFNLLLGLSIFLIGVGIYAYSK
jgi:hypothetical protein